MYVDNLTLLCYFTSMKHIKKTDITKAIREYKLNKWYRVISATIHPCESVDDRYEDFCDSRRHKKMSDWRKLHSI